MTGRRGGWAPPETSNSKDNTVQGRVIYLLILVALLHFIYPVTTSGRLVALLVYQGLYSLMLVAGILVASDSRLHLTVTAGTGIAWLIVSVIYALDPTSLWKTLLTYLVLIPFDITVILVLLRYIFRMKTVTRDVLYAAVTVYILLAAVFVPIYGSLELLQPGSFVDNAAPNAPILWQQFVYYSFVTLTTAGYGDVLPIASWARALAQVEAVVGVLYIAVLMARLVGLYGTGKQQSEYAEEQSRGAQPRNSAEEDDREVAAASDSEDASTRTTRA